MNRRELKTHVRVLLALCALPTAGAGTAADENAVRLTLRLQDQANAIWSALPAGAADARLARLSDASTECVNSALGEARRLLGQGPGARMALRDVSLDLTVPRAVTDRLARGESVPSLLAPYLAAGARGPQVAQSLGDASCGAYYELRGSEGAPGRLELDMQLEAGCGCTQGNVGVHLSGRASLTDGVMEGKDVLRLRAEPARYEVLAVCEPCGARDGAGAAERVRPAGGDACGNLCAPLAQGLAVWRRKIDDAASRLQDLAGKASTVELQVTSDRRELATAESARSKTRAVLEKVSALQARIKAAEAELARVRQAIQDAERALSAVRRVASDTESAEGRCRAQCQARPPDTQGASTRSGAAAAGGGISTGLLIGGGAALAAGGAVALASGGGSETEAPDGVADFSGSWRGTKVVLTDQGTPSGCRHPYEEGWQITQSGSSLQIAVDTIPLPCSPLPNATCPGQCTGGTPFRRPHVGTVSGSIAFVHPYLDYQTPDCAIRMTLQGSAMSGTMPACRTEQPVPVYMEVVMQRVTR